MRRRFVPGAFAGLVIFVASVGANPAVGEEIAANAAPTVVVQRVMVAVPALRDEAAMVLVGTALIGLAAAVRRAA